MNEQRSAKEYAELLIDPRAQTSRTQWDRTPESNLIDVAESLEHIPPVFLEMLVQEGVKIHPLRMDESIGEKSPLVEKILDNAGLTPAEKTEYLEGTLGLHVRDERTIYLRENTPRILVHELGHAVDWALTGGNDPASRYDPIFRGAYESAEILNEQAAISFAESFAETFRAWTGARDAELDPSHLDVRANAEARVPTLMRYLDAIEQSVELALETDPQAFTPGSTFDRRMEIMARAAIAVSMDERPADISSDSIREAMEIVLQSRDKERESIGRPVRADLLPVISPDVPVDDRENFAPELEQRMSVIGRSEDGSRIFGSNGATILSVAAEAFATEPEVGELIRISNDGERDTAQSVGAELALEH